ncbi:hypothetical protein ACFC1T_09610 [Kitasatospora sp. NPDC056076]|uniref:hypothetical protein n=1 Tax=Kitasatospora sp. NPDC056076 TaxID=3345703 RepID=UPI0035E179DC
MTDTTITPADCEVPCGPDSLVPRGTGARSLTPQEYQAAMDSFGHALAVLRAFHETVVPALTAACAAASAALAEFGEAHARFAGVPADPGEPR